MELSLNGAESKKKNLPCLTACPWEAFKQKGFYFTEENYLKRTFELDEIFILKDEYYDLTNRSMFYIEEIRSVLHGRCYMICPKNLKKKLDPVLINIRKQLDLTGLLTKPTKCLLKVF